MDGRRVSDGTIKTAQTDLVNGHRHQVEVVREVRRAEAPEPSYMENVIRVEEQDGMKIYDRVVVRSDRGHTHGVRVEGEGDDAKVILESAQGYFRSRVPVYASGLTFFDKEGKQKDSGVSVGDEWTYRSYVDGGASLSKAVYEYNNFRPERFDNPDLVELELTLGVFSNLSRQDRAAGAGANCVGECSG